MHLHHLATRPGPSKGKEYNPKAILCLSSGCMPPKIPYNASCISTPLGYVFIWSFFKLFQTPPFDINHI